MSDMMAEIEGAKMVVEKLYNAKVDVDFCEKQGWEKIKQSRIKRYFSDIVAAVGFLVGCFGAFVVHNDLIFAFGMGVTLGATAGIVHNIWTLGLHTRELKSMVREMKKAVESEEVK